jgi:dTDP-4-dehydrorhamnose reductase
VKKILITGASGLVGSRFVELYGNKYQLITPEYPDFDLTNIESIKKILTDYNPEVVINLAAFTDVGKAEEQRDNKNDSCYQINVEGTKNLISFFDPKTIHLIHISTDYVFSGSVEDPGPYAEDKLPETDSAKLSWYGFTKAEGERVIKNTLGNDMTILRINFPVRAKYDLKLDYLRKPLSLFNQGKLYPLFYDQQVSITYIDEMCQVLDKIIEGKMYGTFHATTPNTASPYDLIAYLLNKTGRDSSKLQKASIIEFVKNNPSIRYPIKGGLNPVKTEELLGMKFLPWEKVIDELILHGLGF